MRVGGWRSKDVIWEYVKSIELHGWCQQVIGSFTSKDGHHEISSNEMLTDGGQGQVDKFQFIWFCLEKVHKHPT